MATYMVRNVLRDLKRRKIKTVDAYPVKRVRSLNQVSTGATELWEKCGFEKIAEIEALKGEPSLCGGEIILMRKKW